jgi:hypothetical protein
MSDSMRPIGKEGFAMIGASRWGPVQPPLDISGGPVTWWERMIARIGRAFEDFGLHLQSRATARVRAIEKAKFEAAFGKPVDYTYRVSYVSAAGDEVTAADAEGTLEGKGR